MHILTGKLTFLIEKVNLLRFVLKDLEKSSNLQE